MCKHDARAGSKAPRTCSVVPTQNTATVYLTFPWAARCMKLWQRFVRSIELVEHRRVSCDIDLAREQVDKSVCHQMDLRPKPSGHEIKLSKVHCIKFVGNSNRKSVMKTRFYVLLRYQSWDSMSSLPGLVSPSLPGAQLNCCGHQAELQVYIAIWHTTTKQHLIRHLRRPAFSFSAR